jgi:hypothetical protein
MPSSNRPAAIWLDQLALPRELHQALARWVSVPGTVETEALASFGPAVAMPLVTTAALAGGGELRYHVCQVIRQVGDSAVPALLAILNRPLFEAYRPILLRGGMAESGAASDARFSSLLAYANSLEGLAELVGQAHGYRDWFPAARAAALPYLTSEESLLSSPAASVVAWVDMAVELPSNLPPSQWHRQAAAGASTAADVAATGWARSKADHERYLRREAEARAEASRRQQRSTDAAGYFVLDQQRRQGATGTGCVVPMALVLLFILVLGAR